MGSVEQLDQRFLHNKPAMRIWIGLLNIMINDDITIAQFPDKRVKIKCGYCIRRGLFRKTDLMARFGSVASMTNIISELMQCPHKQDNRHVCGAKLKLEKR